MRRDEVNRKVNRGVTVGDLIQQLKRLNQDSPVLFTCNYGDYGRTMQALPVKEISEHSRSVISETPYSQSGLAVDFDRDDECEECGGFDGRGDPACSTCGNHDDDDLPRVVILAS